MSEHRCAKYVYDGLARRSFPCTRNASVEEDGQHWCKQHAPSAERARQAKSHAKWEADREARLSSLRRNAAVHAACAGVDDPQPGELARLRAEVARMKEKV